ncbi:MAG: matrixin family metalloprotease [Planctomycetaceae bacterium]
MRMRAGLLSMLLLFGLAVLPARAGIIESSDYTYAGSTATKWEPGANTAGIGGFPSPGGATFSIMGSGFVDVSGFDPDHTGTTAVITSLGVAGWGMAEYVAMIDWALDTWAAVSGFTNLGVVADGGVDAGAPAGSGGALGDIRVAAWEIATSGVLAHAFQPGTEVIFGPGGTIAGDLHFDIARTWVDDPTDTTADSDFDIYTVALHEIGHSLGLGHTGVAGSVMEAVYAGARRTLGADDIAGIVSIYGPPPPVGPAVPEPSTLLLFGFGSLGLVAFRVSRRRQK